MPTPTTPPIIDTSRPWVDASGRLSAGARELAARLGPDIALRWRRNFAFVPGWCVLCIERLRSLYTGRELWRELRQLHNGSATIVRSTMRYACEESACEAGPVSTGTHIICGEPYPIGLPVEIWWPRLTDFVPLGLERADAKARREVQREAALAKAIPVFQNAAEFWGAGGASFFKWLAEHRHLSGHLAAVLGLDSSRAMTITGQLAESIRLGYGGHSDVALALAATGRRTHTPDPTRRASDRDSRWFWFEIRPGTATATTDGVNSVASE